MRDLDALRLADRLDGVVDDGGEVLAGRCRSRANRHGSRTRRGDPRPARPTRGETQPGPSCQVSLTRSAIAAGFEPAAPANLRSCSLHGLGEHRSERRSRCGPAWSPSPTAPSSPPRRHRRWHRGRARLRGRRAAGCGARRRRRTAPRSCRPGRSGRGAPWSAARPGSWSRRPRCRSGRRDARRRQRRSGRPRELPWPRRVRRPSPRCRASAGASSTGSSSAHRRGGVGGEHDRRRHARS